MTEQEAKTKWCAMVRYDSAQDGSVGTNRCRKFQTGYDSNCIASECMMWRWSLKSQDPCSLTIGTPYSDIDGYCGLGGKP